jgi:sulfite exporter TauE/SafE
MGNVDLAGMFILGVLGTGHCLGMCGPLVLAFPGRTGRFMPHLAYHLGRVGIYAAIGALLGGAGMALTGIGPLLGALWLAAAAALGWLGLVRIGWLREPRWFEALNPERIPGFRRVTGRDGARSLPMQHVLTGAMFGLLPCGLSYAAFARALGTGTAAGGALATLAFGLGTVPGLLLLGSGLSAVLRRHRQTFDLLAGILMVALAVDLVFKAIRAF